MRLCPRSLLHRLSASCNRIVVSLQIAISTFEHTQLLLQAKRHTLHMPSAYGTLINSPAYVLLLFYSADYPGATSSPTSDQES